MAVEPALNFPNVVLSEFISSYRYEIKVMPLAWVVNGRSGLVLSVKIMIGWLSFFSANIWGDLMLEVLEKNVA